MENDLAFIDSDSYIMKFVPKNFLNNYVFKTKVA